MYAWTHVAVSGAKINTVSAVRLAALRRTVVPVVNCRRKSILRTGMPRKCHRTLACSILIKGHRLPRHRPIEQLTHPHVFCQYKHNQDIMNVRNGLNSRGLKFLELLAAKPYQHEKKRKKKEKKKEKNTNVWKRPPSLRYFLGGVSHDACNPSVGRHRVYFK